MNADLSMVDLILHASPVVQAVMLILVFASGANIRGRLQ